MPSPSPSSAETTAQTAELPDYRRLLGELMHRAARLLESADGFEPMACGLTAQGELCELTASRAEGQPQSQRQLVALAAEEAANGRLIAVAVATHIGFRGVASDYFGDGRSVSEGQAICVDLDHRDHPPLSLYLPFRRVDGVLQLADLSMRRAPFRFAFAE